MCIRDSDGVYRDAGGVGGNQNEAQVPMARCIFIALHQAVDGVGKIRAGAPALEAVDHDPAIGRPAGGGAHAGEIAPHVGFREPVGEEMLAPGQLREIGPFLLFGSVLGDIHSPVERAVDEGARRETAAPAEFLDDRHGCDQVLALPSVLGIDGDPADPQVREFAEEFRRKTMLSIPNR